VGLYRKKIFNRVKFSIDSKKLNLPKGIYKGEFTIEARGWHDPSYTKELKVVVRYIVK
jgi:molybdopterin synthase catalytic subunit